MGKKVEVLTPDQASEREDRLVHFKGIVEFDAEAQAYFMGKRMESDMYVAREFLDEDNLIVDQAFTKKAIVDRIEDSLSRAFDNQKGAWRFTKPGGGFDYFIVEMGGQTFAGGDNWDCAKAFHPIYHRGHIGPRASVDALCDAIKAIQPRDNRGRVKPILIDNTVVHTMGETRGC